MEDFSRENDDFGENLSFLGYYKDITISTRHLTMKKYAGFEQTKW
jgi:hypothetical protein